MPNPEQFDASLHATISRLLTETAANIIKYARPGSYCTFSVVADQELVRVEVRSPLGEATAKSWQTGGYTACAACASGST